MKIGENEFKFTTDKAIDAACIGVDIGVDFCVKKLIKEMIKSSLPEPTKLPQKIIFKVGEYAFTAAIGAVVAEKVSNIGMFVKTSINNIKEIKKIKENEENGLGELKAEQQQVQEGE